MIGFSANRPDPFEGVEWRHVLTVLSILHESDYMKTEYIKRQYAKSASHFTETLAFMVCLGAVEEVGGYLRVSRALHSAEKGLAGPWLYGRLLEKPNRYRTEMLRYIRHFRIVNGEPLHAPPLTCRHVQSHVRNFLMEMGMVGYDSKRDCYSIQPTHLNLYVLAQDHASKCSPAAVVIHQRNRDALGAAAEVEVVAYERKRLGAALAGRVQHVALQNASAGYDIRSLTVTQGDSMVPRYIEVKAVSGATLQFYWTRNEVATAKLLAQWYFLYLVPVEAGGRFAVDRIAVIQDPHGVVFARQSGWIVEADVVRCSLSLHGPRRPGESAHEI